MQPSISRLYTLNKHNMMTQLGDQFIPSMGKKITIFSTLFAFVLLLSAGVIGSATTTGFHSLKDNSGQHAATDIHPLIITSVKISSAVSHIQNSISSVASAANKTYFVAQDKLQKLESAVGLGHNHNHSSNNNNNNKRELLETTTSKGSNERSKTALRDCLEVINATLDQLHQTNKDLNGYPYSNKTILKQHADKLKIFMSATMTNQESCLDGFSHSTADRQVRESILHNILHVERMCGNTLAMIKNMTDADLGKRQRNLLSSPAANWLSGDDNRMLLSLTTPDVVVAKDGSGNYTTVSEAVANAPGKSRERYVIKIKAGVYRENVVVDKTKTNIMFVGDGRRNTIITGNRNVRDGSTTFHSATVAISGEGFLARDITFENTAGPEKNQAVALRVNADRSAFYRCAILGYRDTLYAHSMRQFYVDCLIAGTVDIIFGNAAVVFQDCDIHVRNPGLDQQNMITAQGRTDPNQNTGIVIQKSRIVANPDIKLLQNYIPTFLGRPWKEYSRTVVMQSEISGVINPRGWHEWNGTFALDTLVYREYKNTGLGAVTSKRVNWKGYKVITSATEAQTYTLANFIDGSSWLPTTTFPFTLGL